MKLLFLFIFFVYSFAGDIELLEEFDKNLFTYKKEFSYLKLDNTTAHLCQENESGCSVMIDTFSVDKNFFREISLGFGESRNSIQIYRLGFKKYFNTIVWKNSYGWMSGYYEASLNYWQKDRENIFGIAYSPVFVYYFGTPLDNINFYIEAGVGLSFISDTTIGCHNMTSNFHFEDRIGLGIATECCDLNFRYMHYSNASIQEPNDGIDIVIFTLSYPF